MSGRTLTGIAVGLLVFGFVFWNRMRQRSDDSAKIRAEAMQILSTMEGFDDHKVALLPMADLAHTVAFDKAYTGGGRRRAAEFDEDQYLQAFFRSMVSQANQYNRQDLKKSLLALRADIEEAGDDSKGGGDGGGAVVRASGTFGKPEPVTVEIIASIPDEKLEERLHTQCLARIFGPEGGESKGAFKKLPKGMKMIYSTFTVEGEVNNGGYDQFFSNNNGWLVRDAVRGFTLIKAKKHATLTKRAIAAFVRAEPGQKQFKADKSVKKYMETYPDVDLGKIDDEFFKLKENVSELRIKYIRAHPEEFAIQ
ncbi:MAG TPA: DUF4375 domain-containing protein [Phycisphaerae bacterium]|nr:DUF4375 domain-containing protein [Phycisphaerae bacterium]